MLENGTPRQEEPLKTVTGEWTEDAPAVLDRLTEAQFPDSQTEALRASPAPWERGCDWAKAKKIVTLERFRWAISIFESYKVPGSDGTYPVLLQKSMRVLSLPLCKLLRACLATGCLHTQGRESSSGNRVGLQTDKSDFFHTETNGEIS